MRTIISTLAIGFLIANVCVAADHCGGPACCGKTHECCNDCGVRKTCKVVCEMKKVKKTTWVVECEEFCASLPGCGHGCKSSCGGCDDTGCDGGCGGDSCASPRKPMVRPKCGKVRCRKKLVKKTITCEVPVYKCIVVCCNDGCSDGCDTGSDDSVWEKSAPAMAPVSTKSITRAAPLPPRVGKSQLRSLRLDR